MTKKIAVLAGDGIGPEILAVGGWQKVYVYFQRGGGWRLTGRSDTVS